MTKVSLLSDTHSYIDDQILKFCDGSDQIWHAGDIGDLKVSEKLLQVAPLHAVYGNVDDHIIRKEWPLHDRFMVEEISVWITHIGGYPGRYSSYVKPEIIDNPPKLFICGHSHILKVMPDKKLDLLHMNPGAIGKQGFHKKRTMLRFFIDGDKISDLEVVELDRW